MVVTDSTAAIPPHRVRNARVHVVRLDVVVDGVRSLDTDLTGAELLAVLRAGARVSTSQPPPAAFIAAYERAAADGAAGVVSIHLSHHLSGTADAARTAAAQVDLPIEVVDSGTVAMGLGFAVLAAARRAQVVEPVRRRWRWRRSSPVAATLEEVAKTAQEVADSSSIWFLVDSLDHLRRGGRLSGAAAFLGSILQLRPLLTITNGRVHLAGKLRSRRAARAQLEKFAVESVRARGRARLAVHHLGAGEPAEALAEAIRGQVGEYLVDVVIAEAGPVLGAHGGPGLLAVVVADE